MSPEFRTCGCTSPFCERFWSMLYFHEKSVVISDTWYSLAHTHSHCTAGYLSFGPMAQCDVRALKGLACRAPVLLAYAEITKTLKNQWVPQLCSLRYPQCGHVSAHAVSYARSIPPAFLGVVGLDAPINLFSSTESEINVFATSKASVCPTLNITSCDLEALRAEVKKAVPPSCVLLFKSALSVCAALAFSVIRTAPAL